MNYWDRERECEWKFESGGPYFYITTENLDWMLYETREDFIDGTNIVACAAGKTGFTVLDDVQMNNHHHIMGQGRKDTADAFAEHLREGERRLQLQRGNKSLKDWNIRIDQTTDLRQFRNRIAYTDRNAFVARTDGNPTGYQWGAAGLFFNGNLWMLKEGTPYEKLTIRARKAICHSHDLDLPKEFRVLDGMIMRSSFVDYKTTEQLFNSANQYFNMLTKHGEADIEIAAMLGENIQLPNEEVFQIVGSWFPGIKMKEADMETRLKAAKMMKQRLRSSNRQISQVTRLSADDVDRLFPRPA